MNLNIYEHRASESQALWASTKFVPNSRYMAQECDVTDIRRLYWWVSSEIKTAKHKANFENKNSNGSGGLNLYSDGQMVNSLRPSDAYMRR